MVDYKNITFREIQQHGKIHLLNINLNDNNIILDHQTQNFKALCSQTQSSFWGVNYSNLRYINNYTIAIKIKFTFGITLIWLLKVLYLGVFPKTPLG